MECVSSASASTGYYFHKKAAATRHPRLLLDNLLLDSSLPTFRRDRSLPVVKKKHLQAQEKQEKKDSK